jgi:ribosomal protein S16
LGTYNPISNPAQIELNVDAAVKWLKNGAQPTDTARRILSYKGVLLKHHLLGGVAKGALTEEQAEAKFNAWLEAKNNKVSSKEERLAKEKAAAKAKALDAEKETNEKRKNDAAAKAAEAAAAATAEQAEGEAAAETQETEA